MASRKQPLPNDGGAAISSLGALLRERGLRVRDEQPPAPPAPVAPPAAAREGDLSRCGKLVVRRERKGHGGKTVTVVEGLSLPAKQLEKLARGLRTALGCGSRVDAGRIVVQGDLATAVEAWLRKRGAARVVLGN